MSSVNHGERSHALLSASGASRWINCPPSARLTDGMEEERNSPYALEGEAAHEYSEHLLRCYLSGNDGASIAELHEFCKNSIYVDPEMEDKVQEYVDYVIEKYEYEESNMLTTYMAIETQLDYSDWAEEGFGTGDILIVNDARLHVIDLKYGKGVEVSAVDNSQLKMYALGAYKKFGEEYDFENVVLHICQPRLNNFSTFEISVFDLLLWANMVVKPAAKLAFAGEGEYNAGDHCRWCLAKGNCQARADKHFEALEMEFQDPALIPDEDIGSVLHLAMQLKAWASDVESYVKKQVLAGKRIDGWKQVRGRSTRRFTDTRAVQERLEDDFIDESKFLKAPEVMSLSNIEKNIGKKAFRDLLGDLVEVSEGNPTLAPESDPRQAVNTVESDFEGEEWD